MTLKLDAKLSKDLKLFGAEDVKKCYQCGNCSATCGLNDRQQMFPRRQMLEAQLGIEDKLTTSLEPWLCYYCGECSERCPRGAEPGETMMSLRRWLTAKYDFTGISRLFYRSGKAELLVIILTAIATAFGFTMYGFSHGGDINTYDGETAFLPAHAVHLFDWGMAAVLTTLLTINVLRMWWFTVAGRKDIKVGLGSYIANAFALPFHFLTQQRYAKCERRRPWMMHLVLALSYAILFTLVMFFLEDFQAGPETNWTLHAFGYVATLGLIGVSIFAIAGRFKKQESHYKHSHESDWLFVWLLFIVATTGIIQHILHRTGMDLYANIAYVIHLSCVVPMLILEVPFSKWSHMAYRPLAIYFSKVIEHSNSATK